MVVTLTFPANPAAVRLARLVTTGVAASAGSSISLSDSIVAGNVVGINPNGGSIISMQGNNVTSNGTNGTFSATDGKR